MGYSPSFPEILTAASLAHHGLLGSVEHMELEDVDLASVPAEHLASLASSVTESVSLWNVASCVGLLDNIKCKWFLSSTLTSNLKDLGLSVI